MQSCERSTGGSTLSPADSERIVSTWWRTNPALKFMPNGRESRPSSPKQGAPRRAPAVGRRRETLSC